MDILKMLTTDPVVMFSFGFLGILFGICGYYVYYFMKHIKKGD